MIDNYRQSYINSKDRLYKLIEDFEGNKISITEFHNQVSNIIRYLNNLSLDIDSLIHQTQVLKNEVNKLRDSI